MNIYQLQIKVFKFTDIMNTFIILTHNLLLLSFS